MNYFSSLIMSLLKIVIDPICRSMEWGNQDGNPDMVKRSP
jgi:hypothetical protein